MGKMTFEPDEEMTGEEPLYALVAREARCSEKQAREVLVALRKLGFTIATPRKQWR